MLGARVRLCLLALAVILAVGTAFVVPSSRAGVSAAPTRTTWFAVPDAETNDWTHDKLPSVLPTPRRRHWWRRFAAARKTFRHWVFSIGTASVIAGALLFPRSALVSEWFPFDSTSGRTVLQPTQSRDITLSKPSVKGLLMATVTSAAVFHLVRRNGRKQSFKDKDKKPTESSELEKLKKERAAKLKEMEGILDKELETLEEKKARLGAPAEQPDPIPDDNDDAEDYNENENDLPEFPTTSDFSQGDSRFSPNDQFIGLQDVPKPTVANREEKTGVLKSDDSAVDESNRVAFINKESKYLHEEAANTELPLQVPKHIETRKQPKPPSAEEALAAKYAQIPSLSDRAYEVLKDLGMVEESSPREHGEI